MSKPGEGPSDDSVAEQALVQMSNMLKTGDLAGAVKTARALEGSGSAAAPPLADWMNDATARLTAEEAMMLMVTHGSIMNSRMVEQ